MCEPECGVVTSYALNYRRNESSTFSFTGKSLFFVLFQQRPRTNLWTTISYYTGQAKDVVRLRGGSKSRGQP